MPVPDPGLTHFANRGETEEPDLVGLFFMKK